MEPHVTFTCFVCAQQLAVAPEHRGRQVRCPRCQTNITVPSPAQAPTPPSEELEADDDFPTLPIPTDVQQNRRLSQGLETHQARILLMMVVLFITTLMVISWAFPFLTRVSGCFFEATSMLLVACFFFFVPLTLIGAQVAALVGHSQCGGWWQEPRLWGWFRTALVLECVAVGVLALSLVAVVVSITAMGPFRFFVSEWFVLILALVGGVSWLAAQVVFHFYLHRLALHFGDTMLARWAIGILAGWLACLLAGGALIYFYGQTSWLHGEITSKITALAVTGFFLALLVVYGFLYALLTRLRRRVDGKMR